MTDETPVVAPPALNVDADDNDDIDPELEALANQKETESNSALDVPNVIVTPGTPGKLLSLDHRKYQHIHKVCKNWINFL